jgi:hypothetical protein
MKTILTACAGSAPPTAERVKSLATGRPKPLAATIRSECQAKADDFLIATVPDPVRTHLALVFDRNVDAIQEAIQDEGYVLHHAVLPWDNKEHPESASIHLRSHAKLYDERKHDWPGVIVFRRNPHGSAAADSSKRPLVVFLVAEQPTRGIDHNEFNNALALIDEILGPAYDKRSLRVIGPTFTGSLPSLKLLLDHRNLETTVYSGTVSGDSGIRRFKDDLPSSIHFVTFQESDEIMLDRFVKFLAGPEYTGENRKRKYDARSVALLSEDETAYGVSPPASRSSGNHWGDDSNSEDVLRVLFPRGISHLREAYQKNLPVNTRDEKAPRTTLPLNLDASGEDDGVLTFSVKQTPLSQEAIMLGIVSELRKHGIDYVLIRATDPLDTLFITEYLRSVYPSARIVTLEADLLFRREVEDSRMHGVLSLSTYSLIPAANHRYLNRNKRFIDRIFPSSTSAGVYNATRSLLATEYHDPSTSREDCLKNPADDFCRPQLLPKHDQPSYAESTFALFQYAWPEPQVTDLEGADRGPNSNYLRRLKNTYQAPPIHLTTIGRDGYWPIANLGPCPTKFRCAESVLPRIPIGPFDDSLPSPGRVTAANALSTASIPGPRPLLTTQSNAPAEAPVIADDIRFQLEVPRSWLMLELLAVAIAVIFALTLLRSSIFHNVLHAAQFAPAVVDSRVWLIAIIGFLIWLVLLILMYPIAHGRPYMEFGSWLAHMLLLAIPAGVVVFATALDIASRHTRDNPAKWQRFIALLLFMGGVSGFGCGAWASGPTFYERLSALPQFGSLRAMQLTSGASFVLPIFFALAGGLWWSYNVCAGCVLVDDRRPRLPCTGHLDRMPMATSNAALSGAGLGRIGEEASKNLIENLRFSPRPYRVPVIAAMVSVGVVLIFDWQHPLRSLERQTFEIIIFIAVVLLIFGLIGSAVKLWEIWIGARTLLSALDSLPLRRAFRRLDGFSWKPLWTFGSSGFADFTRALARETEAFDCMIKTCGHMDPAAHDAREQWNDMMSKYMEFLPNQRHELTSAELEKLPEAVRVGLGVEESMIAAAAGAAATGGDTTVVNIRQASSERTRTIIAEEDGYLTGFKWADDDNADRKMVLVMNHPSAHQAPTLRGFIGKSDEERQKLKDSWDTSEAQSVARGGFFAKHRQARAAQVDLIEQFGRVQQALGQACTLALAHIRTHWIEEREQVPLRIREKEPDSALCVRACERFIALVYVSFLLVVMMRMRTLIVAIAGMYVFLVLAVSSYPFEPKSAVQGLLVGMLLFICGIVVIVFAGIHRDAILSNLTDSKPGELGGDFWLRIISFGALPVLGFFASQLPQVNGAIYSWLQPALEAIK